MSNMKSLADIMKVCSVLPLFAVAPAMADLPNTSGNAWVFGDLNLNYSTANGSAIGGRVSVVNGERGNDFPNYNVVGRSVKLQGDADNRPSVYVGPVNMTLRELQTDEAFAYNWQKAGDADSSNWGGTELADGEVSYVDFDIAKEKGIVWGDTVEKILSKNGWGPDVLETAPKMVYGLYLFAQRDQTKTAGMLATEAADLTLDGTKLFASDVLLNNTLLNIVNKNVPSNFLNGIHNASDGKTKIVADSFSVKDNSRIVVGADAELDLTESEEVLVQNNKAETSGGAISVSKGGVLNVDNASIVNNSSSSFGGAIWNQGTVNVNNAQFDGNTALSGGAISMYTAPTAGTYIEGSTFTNNHAEDGGAVSAFNKIQIVNSVFDGNTAMYSADENGEYTVKMPTNNNPIGGGALALGSTSETKVASISGTTFKNNKSGYNGGAIGTRLADTTAGGKNANSATLNVAATFINNFAENNGGAIYNTFYNDNESGNGRGVTVSGIFEENKAGGDGGAIFNDGRKDLAVKDAEGNVISGDQGGVMTVYNATFDKNYAANNGGAVYNTGTLVIQNSDFEGNKITSGNGDGGAIYSNTGSLVVKDTDFEDNSAYENPEGNCGYGGAIYVQGGTVDIQGSEDEMAEFSENHALTGGAVYVSKHTTSTTIKNVEFVDNWASDIGALGIFGKDTTLTNLLFEGNRATGEFAEFDFNDGGGALFFGSEAQAVLDNGVFRSNESAGVGGAIATRSPNKGDNSAAKLDVLNSTFSKNVAETQGGAIYTAFYNSKEAINHIYVANTTFVANKAEEGGAIYNEGMADRGQNYAAIKLSDVTFKDNHASSAGGAIYNAKGGTVALSGKNTFADNTVDKAIVDNHSNNIHKNDIHNDGELNIIDGVTTIGGGVTGSGTLNLATGATLDIGTSLIKQGVMNIDGTLVASVLNDSRKSFGRLDGTVNVGDTAKLQLNVGAVGTYDIFAGQFIDADRITVGNAYTAHATEQGIVIETKAIEDLAADTGLTTQAAGMIAGLANSDNKSVQSISLMAQEALNAGDVEFVEQEMAKLNPTSTPVAQAVSASVQNQVLSLTAGRMSGVGTTVGRAGGSASQQSGFWLQGLFNKSKYEGQFHGYTRGFAFGGDTVLDRVLTLGGGFAYNNTDVHATDGRHTDIDSKTLFAYAQYKPNKWYANLTATYSMSEYNEDVSVLGVLSNVAYDVDAYGAQFMTGYDFASGVTTEIGARYMHVAQDAYVNAVGGEVQADKTNFLSGVAGLKYAFTIKNNSGLKFRPELRAAATYDFVNDGAVATVVMPGAASYQVSGDSLSRLGGEFGVGLTAQFNGGDLSIMYDLDLHTDYTSHTGMVKFRGWF